MRWALLLFFVLLILLAQARPEVTLQVTPKTVEPNGTIRVSVINDSGSELKTTYSLTFHRLQDGEWVPVDTGLVFVAVLVTIPPGEVWEQEVRLPGLEAGRYRVEKVAFLGEEKLTLSDEFEVVG